MKPEAVTLILVAVAITIVVFLVCRELICWYWKINKTTLLLEDILVELREANGKHKKVD